MRALAFIVLLAACGDNRVEWPVTINFGEINSCVLARMHNRSDACFLPKDLEVAYRETCKLWGQGDTCDGPLAIKADCDVVGGLHTGTFFCAHEVFTPLVGRPECRDGNYARKCLD